MDGMSYRGDEPVNPPTWRASHLSNISYWSNILFTERLKHFKSPQGGARPYSVPPLTPEIASDLAQIQVRSRVAVHCSVGLPRMPLQSLSPDEAHEKPTPPYTPALI